MPKPAGSLYNSAVQHALATVTGLVDLEWDCLMPACRNADAWRSTRKMRGAILVTYLDLDHVAEGRFDARGVLAPIELDDWPSPASLSSRVGASGTLVVWRNCDRLNPKNFDGLK